MSSLIIFAPNIHSGGGRSLLIPLLEELENQPETVAFVDDRLAYDCSKSQIDTHRVRHTLVGRFNAEIVLRKIASAEDTIVFFGNLPPLMKLRGRKILYLQNRLLLDDVSLKAFAFKTRIRLELERKILKVFHKNIDDIFVQTNSMKQLVKSSLGRDASVVPFYDKDFWKSAEPLQSTIKYDFIYVASGEPQKNHRKLIDAWVLLAKEDIYPSLCLTLGEEKDRRLLDYIQDKKDRYRLNIDFKRSANNVDIKALYRCSKALIYPSKLESFGLPLLEARDCGLHILATECEYVRDVISPDLTFNADCELSIANAVKQHMNIGRERPVSKNIREFVSTLSQY